MNVRRTVEVPQNFDEKVSKKTWNYEITFGKCYFFLEKYIDYVIIFVIVRILTEIFSIVRKVTDDCAYSRQRTGFPDSSIADRLAIDGNRWTDFVCESIDHRLAEGNRYQSIDRHRSLSIDRLDFRWSILIDLFMPGITGQCQHNIGFDPLRSSP